MRTKMHELFAIIDERTEEAVGPHNVNAAEDMSVATMLGALLVARVLASAL